MKKVISLIIALAAIAVSGCDQPSNNPPEVSAGEDQTVTLSASLNVVLSGSVTNSGTIASHVWTCTGYTKNTNVNTPYTLAEINALISGSGTGANPTATVPLRKAGVYIFQLAVTDNDGGVTTKTVQVTVNTYQEPRAQDVTVTGVPFSIGATLDLLAGTPYSFAGAHNAHFTDTDLSGITFELTSIHPDRTWAQLQSHVSNGKLSVSTYETGNYPIITQTFYYNGQAVGSRKFVAEVAGSNFAGVYENNTDDQYGTDGTVLDPPIPPATLNLSKNVTIAEL